MLRRFISVSLVIIMAVLLVSCSAKNDNSKSNTETTSKAESSSAIEVSDDYSKVKCPSISNSGYSAVTIDYGYKALKTRVLKNCYKQLKENVYYISSAPNSSKDYTCKIVTIEGTKISESQLRLVISAFEQDNPLVFWLADSFGYSYNNDTTTFQLYSEESYDVIQQKLISVVDEINTAVASVSTELSQFEREIALHDYILDICEYSEDIAQIDDTSDHYEAFTVYGTFVEKSAVCEGYAKSFELLLALFGIDNRIILGTGEQDLHMWNAVNIEEQWFYVDPSWDDGDNYSRYDYFNIDEEHLSADHTINKLYDEYTDAEICGDNGEIQTFNIVVPDCNTMNYNYYVRNACELSSLDTYYDQFIEQDLYQIVEDGKDYLYLYINPTYLDYDLTVEKLFYSGERKFFTYVNDVNNMLTYKTIDKNNLSIVKKKSLNVVTVKLSY